MNLFAYLQTETYKDVKIIPDLTEEQKGEIMELLEEFKKRMFSLMCQA